MKLETIYITILYPENPHYVLFPRMGMLTPSSSTLAIVCEYPRHQTV